MPHRIRRQLSFANVTSLCALVFAMGGTGYALTIPRNSVGTKQIKTNGVGASEIKNNAVKSGEVKNGSLLAADFGLGQIPQGPRGATGAPGVQGPQGNEGATGLYNSTIVRRTDVPLPQGAGPGLPGAITSAFATCNPGEKIVGGSANISNNVNPSTMELLSSRPSVDTTGNGGAGTVPADGGTYAYWKGTARTLTNAIAPAPAMRVFAICAVP